MLETRLLDLGRVPAIRSQTIYHAVAQCAAATDIPTLCILHPDRPYVSIGYHQQADREVDLDYCREHAIPVVRRMVGGGAVLLDEDQIFFHVIVPEGRIEDLGIPARLGDRYPRLAAPAIAAYRRIGVPASFRPVNDIHVNGRKIGGTGTATIENSFVFVGSMMIDFDHGLMSRVLRFSDEKMRDKVRSSMEEHVTSLRRETASKLRMEYVQDALLQGFRDELGLDLVPGVPTAAELARAEELDREFGQEEWLHRIAWSSTRARKLAINCAVRYLEAEHKAPGGLLRMAVRVSDGKVDDLLLSGDFSALPGKAVDEIRHSFLGAALSAEGLEEPIRRTWQGKRFDMPGVTAEDFSALARKLVEAGGA